MTQSIKNTLAIMSERVSPRAGSVTLSELRAYQSAWLDGAFYALALVTRTNNEQRPSMTQKDQRVEDDRYSS
jgi:hypothetical protein